MKEAEVLKPNIGDTVIIEGVVVHEYHNCCGIFTGGGLGFISVDHRRIKSIIRKPWTPKVGDSVWIKGKPHLPRKLLALNGDGGSFAGDETRRWAVVAFKDDIPEVYFASQLRKDQSSCAD